MLEARLRHDDLATMRAASLGIVGRSKRSNRLLTTPALASASRNNPTVIAAAPT
jgi:hypothetical protein